MRMMRSWVLVYLGNFLGAFAIALMMIVADGLSMGETYANAGRIAAAKLCS